MSTLDMLGAMLSSGSSTDQQCALEGIIQAHHSCKSEFPAWLESEGPVGFLCGIIRTGTEPANCKLAADVL